ncbi:MAG: nitrogen fixation protein NifZ [Rhodocyclaceae bacterium]|nr:nitrogen fixation protein NifZ [Rhodocyclaceae bacterium]
MDESRFRIGEMVFASARILNDGGLPDLALDAVIAEAGSKGVVVRCGHLAELPDAEVFLVRFEDAGGTLGPPVGCLAEELASAPPA